MVARLRTDQVAVAGQLLDHVLQTEVAIGVIGHLLPEEITHLRTANWSNNMSASPTRMTTPSELDSFTEESEAGFSSFFSFSFGSAGLSVGVSLGLPSGNAVLNFPFSRTAKANCLPEAAKSFTDCSPENSAMNLSTSCDARVLFRRTVCLRPSAGVPVNAPENGIQALSSWLVMTSSVHSS